MAVVDRAFVADFLRSRDFAGLNSLYEAAIRFDDILAVRNAHEPSYESVRVGDYIF